MMLKTAERTRKYATSEAIRAKTVKILNIKTTYSLVAGRIGYMKKKVLHECGVFVRSSGLSKVFSRENNRQIALIARCFLYFIFSFSLGCASLPMGIYPFGTALLCAGTKYTFFIFLGSAASCLTYSENALPFFCLNILIFFIRKTLTKSKYNENKLIKTAYSLSFGILIGIVRLITGGLTLPNAIVFFAYASVLSGVTYIFCGFFEKSFENSGKIKSEIFLRSAHFEAAVCIMTFAFIYSIKDLFIGSYSLSAIVAGIMTLCAVKTGGVLYGGAFGLICGLASGSVFLSPVLGIAGILSGIMSGKSNAGLISLFSLSSAGLAVYIKGTSAFSQDVPNIIVSALLFIPLAVFLPSGLLNSYGNVPLGMLAERNLMQKNLDGLSDAFCSLSQIFFKLSDRLRYPAEQEINYMIDRVFKSKCKSCSMQSLCYGKQNTDIDKMKNSVCGALLRGNLTKADIPEKLCGRCIMLDGIIGELTKEYKELLNDYFKNNKTEILAQEYSSMARIIKYTSQKSKKDLENDQTLENAAAAALKRVGVKYGTIRAYGKRSKIIEAYGVTVDKLPCAGAELSDYLSESLGILFSEPEFIINEGCFIMRFTQRKKISVEYSQSSYAKGGNNVNGDSISFFENDEDYFYSLISDGMGSGREAALTSRLTAVFIEKLLTTGAHKTVTLELLNNLLLSKNDESFATVDLLEIDMLNAQASFIKAGAAPAYVIRSTKLYKIASATPPAGIIQGFSAEKTKFDLKSGDIIVMLSDGIIQSFNETPWLSELLSFDSSDDPAKLANSILERAKYINIREDDMSVVALKIK